MTYTLVYAAVLLGVGVFGFGLGDHNYTAAAVFSALSFIPIGAYTYNYKQDKRSKAFAAWLGENVEKVMQGGASYEGVLITPKTELVRYTVACSILILTAKQASPLMIADKDDTTKLAAIYTLISLVFGWWGIPWGPIYTVQAVYNNLRGGTRQTIQDILTQKTA
jgi:hypothetical protein